MASDEKLDRIIALLEGIHGELESLVGADHSYLVYSELGTLRDVVERLEETVRDIATAG
jgi:archaellum component FlaC